MGLTVRISSRISIVSLAISGLVALAFLAGLGCPQPGNNGSNGATDFPSLGVDTKFIDLGGVSSTAPASFSISNVGSGKLDYQISSYTSSTTMAPVQGSLTSESQIISLNIDVSSIETGPFGIPGMYSDMVTVESNGGLAQVEISGVKVEGSNPVITSVVPNFGAAGDTVTISGANFNGGTGLMAVAPKVFFGESEAEITGAGTGSITVTVPDGISGNNFNVRVLTGAYSQPAPVDFYLSNTDVRAQSAGGLIRDKNNGQPIDNAYIELTGQDTVHAAVTGPSGRFTLSPPPSIGVYVLRAGRDGYLWKTNIVAIDSLADIDVTIELTPILRQDFQQTVYAYVVGEVYADAYGSYESPDYILVEPEVILENIGLIDVSDFIWAPQDQCVVIDLASDFSDTAGVIWDYEEEFAVGLDAGEPIRFGGAAEGGDVLLYHSYDLDDPYEVDENSQYENLTFHQGQMVSFDAPGGFGISAFSFQTRLPRVISGLPSLGEPVTLDPTGPTPYVLRWTSSQQPGTRVWLMIMPTVGFSTKIMICNLVDDGRFVIPGPKIAKLGLSSANFFSYRVSTKLVPLTYPEDTWLMVFSQSYSLISEQ
ncbi:IPT/TIG domain-containing protein [Candidatus Hydrogenedentota bacterium]